MVGVGSLVAVAVGTKSANTKLIGVAAALGLGSSILLLIGAIVYSDNFNLSYSYILFIAAGAMAGASLPLLLATFALHNNAGLGLLLGSLVLSIIAMATHGWYVQTFGANEYEFTLSVGLTDWSITGLNTDTDEPATCNLVLTAMCQAMKGECDGETCTGSVGDLAEDTNYPLLKDIKEGGDAILGCGVVSALVCFVTLIAVGSKKAPRQAGFGAAVVAALDVLGVALYAGELNLGYSYIFFTMSAFVSLLAAPMLAASRAVNTSV